MDPAATSFRALVAAATAFVLVAAGGAIWLWTGRPSSLQWATRPSAVAHPADHGAGSDEVQRVAEGNGSTRTAPTFTPTAGGEPVPRQTEAAGAPAAVSVSELENEPSGHAGEIWDRPECHQLDLDTGVLRLRVYRGMSLTGLAVHFSVSTGEVRALNPQLRGDRLYSGSWYAVPTRHLVPLRHRVRGGETLAGIVSLYGAPSHISVRTWNCLPDNRIRAGDELLVLADPDLGFARPLGDPDVVGGDCFAIWSQQRVLRLRVCPGETLTSMADAIGVQVEVARRACRSAAGELVAGLCCDFDIAHLEATLDTLAPGETLAGLASRRHLEQPERIETWNCLRGGSLRSGQPILVLERRAER